MSLPRHDTIHTAKSKYTGALTQRIAAPASHGPMASANGNRRESDRGLISRACLVVHCGTLRLFPVCLCTCVPPPRNFNTIHTESDAEF